MAGLEELFALGTISKEFTIGETIKMRLNVLDTKNLQDALNASYGIDESAKFVDYKKNVLARSITHCNGVTYIHDAKRPTPEEVKKVTDILNGLHVSIINKLYDFYDELDTEAKKNLDTDVKK